jgi:carbon-monoxide dehydrogenase large subunit
MDRSANLGGGETREAGVDHVRREDAPLLRGEATYVGDITPSNALHAAVHRSRFAHARVESVDTEDAEAHDDVVAVYTAADLSEADVASAIPIDAELPGQTEPPRPVLAGEKVRHAGEPIALVLAESAVAAHDAAETVDVSYDRLETVTDAREALEDDAPLVHEDQDDNSGLDWEIGDDEADVDEVFADAPHVVEVEVHNQRLLPNPIEPRGLVADPDPSEGECDLHLRMATQMPHVDRGLFAKMLGMDEASVRVSAPSVGGAFGVKALPYPDHVLVGWAAIESDRPVKWVATRTESHLADHHGRAFTTQGEYALDEDGTVLAFRTDAVMNMGAYMVYPTTPWIRYEILSSGPYEIPTLYGHLRAAFTNTGPVAPYRGAGRPEIIYLHERLMDRAADELDVDPAEIRRRNFVPPDAFPYETPGSATYDSGDYGGALEKALETADYEEWRDRQADRREEGRYVGVGVASFVEDTGQDPGVPESGRVELDGDGATVRVGTADQGQGHATTFAGMVADELGIDPEAVAVDEGDTDSVDVGAGTFGSRSVAVGGSAVAESAREVREEARELAARELEASADDLEFEDGEFGIRGAPGRSIGIREVAERAAAGAYSDGFDDGLSATTVYDPSNHAFAFGTHVAVVEVDVDTGEFEFHRYVAVDDCGVQIDPKLVEGQVHGGVAQGIGQARYEQVVYDDNGSLVTGSLQDYALPKSHQIPDIEVEETVTPSPHNPIGAKGVGEGGAIVAPPTVVNAVVDALEPFGVDHVEMPLTAERVWRAANGAREEE